MGIRCWGNMASRIAGRSGLDELIFSESYFQTHESVQNACFFVQTPVWSTKIKGWGWRNEDCRPALDRGVFSSALNCNRLTDFPRLFCELVQLLKSVTGTMFLRSCVKEQQKTQLWSFVKIRVTTKQPFLASLVRGQLMSLMVSKNSSGPYSWNFGLLSFMVGKNRTFRNKHIVIFHAIVESINNHLKQIQGRVH